MEHAQKTFLLKVLAVANLVAPAAMGFALVLLPGDNGRLATQQQVLDIADEANGCGP